MQYIDVVKETNALSLSKNYSFNQQELLFLRLYAHDFNSVKIRYFLQYSNSEMFKLKKNIKEKCETDNWFQILRKAFKDEHLIKKDYVDPVIKEIALRYLTDLYWICCDHERPIEIKDLRYKIFEYYNKCMAALREEQNNSCVFKLCEIEKKFINLNFKGYTNEHMTSAYGWNKNKLYKLKSDVLNKLDTTNWFGIFKKAIHLDAIKKPGKSFIIVENEVIKTSNAILKLLKIADLQEKEKKMIIYDQLLEFYSNTEFLFLFIENHDEV